MKHAMIALLLLAAVPAVAADLPTAGRNYFTDVELTNQNGEKMRLYSDLIAGKTVVINSFYTTCVGICPIMAGTFKRIQTALGDHLGKDLILVSVTVEDIERCQSPARVQLLAEKGVAEPLMRAVEDLLAACDFARFAPGAQSREEMAKVQGQAAEIIAALEKRG